MKVIDLLKHSQLELISFAEFVRHYPGPYARFAEEDLRGMSTDLNLGSLSKSEQTKLLEEIKNILDSCSTAAKLKATLASLPPIKVNQFGSILEGKASVAIALSGILDELDVDNPTGKSSSIGDHKDEVLNDKYIISPIQLDKMVLEYADKTKRIRFILLFNGADGFQTQLRDFVSDHGRVVYQKDMVLTESGVTRLVEFAYSMNDWWWSSSFSKKISQEKFGNHSAPYDASIVLYEPFDESVSRENKLEVRERMKNTGFTGSLHGSDQWHDTKPVLDLILSGGGLHFMNFAPYGAEHRIIKKLSLEFKNAGIQRDEVVIGGSTILELHGLRSSRDIDYYSVNGPVGANVDWDCRNNQLSTRDLWEVNKAENQLRIHGFRFQSLTKYAEIQQRRVLKQKGARDFKLAAVQLGNLQPKEAPAAIRLQLLVRQVAYYVKSSFITGVVKKLTKLPAPLKEFLKSFLPRRRSS